MRRRIAVGLIAALVVVLACGAVRYLCCIVPSRDVDGRSVVARAGAVGRDHLFEYYQAVVRAEPHENHVTGASSARLRLCDDFNLTRCTNHAYVIPGNVLLISREIGQHLFATYVGSTGASREGWVPSGRVAKVPLDQKGISGWTGWWRARSSDITMHAPDADGAARAEGYGTFGLDDPELARRGAISIGEFSETIRPQDNLAAFSTGEDWRDRDFDTIPETACKLRLQRVGEYMVVNDNHMCGGHNFSFTDIYRRVKN